MRSLVFCFSLCLVPLLGCSHFDLPTLDGFGWGKTRFWITWENAPSFDDGPSLDDHELDAWCLKEYGYPRFSPEHLASGGSYFPSGTFRVDLDRLQGIEAARRVGEAVARKVVGGPPYSRVKATQPTRFGYYVRVDWGYGEENFTGHVVELVVELDRRIIWWYRCE